MPTDSSDIKDYYIYIKSNISDNYIRILEKNKYIHRMIGYYDDNNDNFLAIYQYGKTIAYYSVQNVSYLYYYESETKTVQVISNYSMIFNVSELITYPPEHELLTLAHVVHYPNTGTKSWQYNNSKIFFTKTTQLLNITSANNDWMTLQCFYRGGAGTDFYNLTLYFVFPNSLINIRTCAFKCGSCSEDLYMRLWIMQKKICISEGLK